MGILIKRKNFSNKIDLYPDLNNETILRSEKHYDCEKSAQIFPENTTIFFPKNSFNRTTYEFSKFYGKGCDGIVFSFQKKIQCVLETSINTNGKSLSIKTILGYCRGASNFLSYCIFVTFSLNKTITLSDVNKSLIIGFIEYLENRKLKRSTPRAYYKSAKQILILLGKDGKMQKDIFPKNPFPNSGRILKG